MDLCREQKNIFHFIIFIGDRANFAESKPLSEVQGWFIGGTDAHNKTRNVVSASCPIHEGLHSFAGITLPSVIREDGVAKFHTAGRICFQIFRAGQGMKADVSNHGLCCAQTDGAQEPGFEGGVFTHLLQAQFHQPFRLLPLGWNDKTNDLRCGFQVVPEAGFQEVR